jgi:uncharacterized C2H2 Zn-finger protein
MGRKCPKCGKIYQNNRGGWFSKHVQNCQKDGDVSGVGVEKPEPPKGVQASEGLKCPKCGKIYKSKAGGWYEKHINKCGSSQD